MEMESVTALIRTTVQLQIVYLYSCESTLFSFCFVLFELIVTKKFDIFMCETIKCSPISIM